MGAEALLTAVNCSEQRILQKHFRRKMLTMPFWRSFLVVLAFLKALKVIKKVAKADANVFIRGETGTGKELSARAVHYLSERRDEPFVPINCGAFSDDLILSELFGHEKGAFTGANKNKIGLLELANNGTVFLDEVTACLKSPGGITSLLQDNEVRQIGGSQ